MALTMAIVLAAISPPGTRSASGIEPIDRRLPPPGKPIPEADARDLAHRATSLRARHREIADTSYAPDAEVYLGAVELAMEFGEFYALPDDLEKARKALYTAERRIDAHIDPDERRLEVTTKNVTAFRIRRPLPEGTEIIVDGSPAGSISAPTEAALALTRSQDDTGPWLLARAPASGTPRNEGLRKSPGLQGPIDDAFLSAFLVVPPSGDGMNAAVDAWVRFELDHLRSRWKALFRGTLPERRFEDLTPEDIQTRNLVFFGDPKSHPLMARLLDQLPLRWSDQSLELAGISVSPADHVPVLIHPNPENPTRYVVINSGPTFRDAHDRTNSLQNPKLPDWALLEIATRPPDAEAAGNVAMAGFLDESWKPAPESSSPLTSPSEDRQTRRRREGER